MPYINSVGSVCHGISGAGVCIDNVQKFVGAVGGWLDDDRVACASGVPGDLIGTEWPAMIYTVSTNSRVMARTPPSGANTLYAGGDHMAWWWAAAAPLRGLYATTGLRLPLAGLLGMGPDGAIGYKPNYSSSGPTRVRERSGADWLLTTAHAYELQLLGGRRAIWRDSVAGLRVVGLPTPSVLATPVFFPFAFLIGGAWWIGYQTVSLGTIAHPFDDPNLDHVLVGAGVAAWPAFRALSNNSFRFAWASTEAEAAGQITALTVTIAGVAPGPVPPLPPPEEGGGPGPGEPPSPPISGVVTGPRAEVAPRPRFTRQYPHVDGIEDWRAQQTTRLLWDRVFDLEERLQSSETTAADLVDISNTQDASLDQLASAAGRGGTGGGGAGGGGGVGKGSAPPDVELPDMSGDVADYTAANPGDFANHCKDSPSFSWAYLSGLVSYLQGIDPRVGGNGKRGDTGDPSTDAISYYHQTAMPPVGGSNDVYVIDVISSSCSAEASPSWTDVTTSKAKGAWMGSVP